MVLKKEGFTLSETLVTLAVIGIVAALTIPAIAKNYQKQETISRLKKVYSSLNQAVTKGIIDNGSMTFWDDTNDSQSSEILKQIVQQYFVPYLNVTTNCIYASKPICSSPKYNLNKVNIGYNRNHLILNDGVDLSFGAYCCGFWIFADINGAKGPNTLGKDVFMLDLKRSTNTVKFWGQGYSRHILREAPGWGGYYCKSGMEGSYVGGFCGAMIMLDGWQISDDYPWDLLLFSRFPCLLLKK